MQHHYGRIRFLADLRRRLEQRDRFDAIRASGIRLGVDPLGGAGVHYWARIAEHYRIDLAVVSEQVDPTFSFMTLDWTAASAWIRPRPMRCNA